MIPLNGNILPVDETLSLYAQHSAVILKESGQSFGIKEVIALILISGGIFIVQKGKADKVN